MNSLGTCKRTQTKYMRAEMFALMKSLGIIFENFPLCNEPFVKVIFIYSIYPCSIY